MDLGVALVPGHGWTRHAFVTIDDVATFVVEALFRSDTEDGLYHLGGPEVLTWDEAADACAAALGRRVLKIHVPPVAYRFLQVALERLAPPAANLLGRAWIQAQWETVYGPAEARPVLAASVMVVTT